MIAAKIAGGLAGLISRRGSKKYVGAYLGAGLGLSAMTGDWRWMGVGAAAAAGTGAARGLGFTEKMFPMVGHGMVGAAAGLATGSPYMTPVGMGVSKVGGWAAKGMFGKGPSGAAGLLRGYGNAMIGRSGKAASILSTVEHPGWGGFLLGGGLGAASATSKIFTHKRIDPTQGYYPGSISSVPDRRGKNVPNDFLSTTGLTLALHKNSRTRSRIV